MDLTRSPYPPRPAGSRSGVTGVNLELSISTGRVQGATVSLTWSICGVTGLLADVLVFATYSPRLRWPSPEAKCSRSEASNDLMMATFLPSIGTTGTAESCGQRRQYSRD